MKEYIKGAETILRKGFKQKAARAGMVGTKSYTGLQLRFDLSKGRMPILTTKKVSYKNVVVELLWFLKGDSNIKYLNQHGCKIWNQNAYDWFCKLVEEKLIDCPMMTMDEFIGRVIYDDCVVTNMFVRKDLPNEVYHLGDCGKIYGYQWRKDGVDQIVNSINMLINQPYSRQNKVVAWNPKHMNYNHVCQPNCHGDYTITGRDLDTSSRINILKYRMGEPELKASPDEINALLVRYNIPKIEFTLSLNQRSADYALGVPYNVTSYATLMYIYAILTNCAPRLLITTFTDAHVYVDHSSTLMDQCKREVKNLPVFKLQGKSWQEHAASHRPETIGLDAFLNHFNVEDFQLENYQHHGEVNYELHTGTLVNKQNKRK